MAMIDNIKNEMKLAREAAAAEKLREQQLLREKTDKMRQQMKAAQVLYHIFPIDSNRRTGECSTEQERGSEEEADGSCEGEGINERKT